MARPISILELRSVWGTGGGPEKTILFGAKLHDPGEFKVTVCYIRDTRDPVFAIDKRAIDLGVDYVEVLERGSVDVGVWRPLLELMKDRRIEIVHSHDYKTDLVAWLLARRTGAIPLATSHGWSGYGWKERYLYYPVDLLLLRWFPHVIAVSSPIRDRLLRWGVPKERVSVLLNAIDPEAFKRNAARRGDVLRSWNLPADAIVAGSIGRLEQVKRFDVLIDAFARIAETVPALHLVIAGDGTLRADLEAQIARLGLATRCRLPGHLADIRGAHDGLDVYVQSSESEGTPNAVLEAMAMETALVATDVGGTTELAFPDIHGVIVPRNDVPALAAGIMRVLRDPAAAAERTRAARRRIEDVLSFRARTAVLENTYTRLARPLEPARAEFGRA